MAKPHIAILCVKKHEFDEMVEQVEAKIYDGTLDGQVVTTNGTAWKKTSSRHYCTNRFDLTLFSFVDKQGPVVAATRVTMVVMQSLSSANKITHMGMVGICGGQRLGDVVVGWSAHDSLGGHFTESEEPFWKCDFCQQPEADERPCRHFSLQQNKEEFFQETIKEPLCHWGEAPRFAGFDVILNGKFESYPHVNDDLLDKVDKTTGLEMEAFAMFHALKTLHESGIEVTPLPVIKGVSDVDKRVRNPEAQDELCLYNCRQVGDADGEPRAVRKKYRQTAGKHAAQVMVAYLIKHFKAGGGTSGAGGTSGTEAAAAAATPPMPSLSGGISMNNSVIGTMQNSHIGGSKLPG